MTDFRTRTTAWQGNPARKGFTLIEMGFVIGLLGLLGVLASYVYIEGVEREAIEARDADTVRDVLEIVDALRSYATGNSSEFWPTYDDGCLHVRALVIHGYLRRGTPSTHNSDASGGYLGSICDGVRLTGPTRYVTCGTQRSARCIPYTLHLWDQRARSRHSHVSYGNSIKLEERRREGGGNGFHLLLFFGFPGDWGNADDRARAESIAARLPNAQAWNSSFAHQIYIGMVLFQDSSFIRGTSPYIRIDGEDRPVIFRPGRGVLGGMRQLAVDDEPHRNPPRPRSATPAHLNDGYPRIRMLPPDPPGRVETRLLLMGDNTDQQDEASVTFDAADSSAVYFTVADRKADQGTGHVTVPHHSLAFSNWPFLDRPGLDLRRQHGGALKMWLRERRRFHNIWDWDIDLTAAGGHKSLRTRLCALERSTDDPDTDTSDPSVPVDVTCP